jgi:hypothetical protein
MQNADLKKKTKKLIVWHDCERGTVGAEPMGGGRGNGEGDGGWIWGTSYTCMKIT